MLNPTQRRCRIAGMMVVSVLLAYGRLLPRSRVASSSACPKRRDLRETLYLHFTQGADATNLAVMADTDAASAAFARDASQKMDIVQNDTKALRPILAGLMFSNELHLLDQFDKQFANYRALDRTILDLSVENTNLKAQRLSIGPAQELVEAFPRRAWNRSHPRRQQATPGTSGRWRRPHSLQCARSRFWRPHTSSKRTMAQ